MSGVTVVGGGPSGLAAAIALAERGLPVCVIDAQGGCAGDNDRAELLPQGAADIMVRLGLGDCLRSALKISDIQSTWGTAKLQAHGANPDLGLYGWGIERRALAAAMSTRAKTLGVDIHKSRVTHSERAGEGWQLALTSEQGTRAQTARYVIDATGRRAAIARAHGAKRMHNTDLVGLIWHVRGDGSAIMHAQAANEGWWYSVPSAHSTTIGFMTSAQTAKQLKNGLAAARAVLDARPDFAKAIDPHTKPYALDARSAVLTTSHGTRWLAAGDAAASFDPIASQGLFNALSGGFFAGNAAADALQGEVDAPLLYAALAARTAERTHASTHLQYRALPYDTPFWRCRSGPKHAA